jgi:superfamily II DNA or RNA helicase
MTRLLRRWQVNAREVVQTLRIGGLDRALIAAAPGTGKTLYTASLIADDLAAGVIGCAVIVTPSRAIKKQWRNTFREYGLKAIDDIDNATLDEHRARNLPMLDPARPIFIVTYQQICSGAAPETFAVLCARHKVFAVFDEIHHADDQAEFGQSLIAAFEDAIFKLSLSGTPATTKGSRLAFCNCERKVSEDGKHLNVTIADYTYSYGEALMATGAVDDPNVVRPVTFIRWNGQARWRYQNIANPDQFTERIFDGSRKTDSLAPLLDPDGDYFKKMLRAALDELEEVRQHHSNAGLLITTIDADHCEQIAELVRSFGIHDVVVVRYDMPGAHKLIEDFERGHQRVLVAIKMIAEGVNIVRLRVGVYASDAKTWMYFMQFIGRFIRWDSSLNAGQFASVFIPEHVTLLEYAKKIEQMVLEAIIPEKGPEGPTPGPQQTILIDRQSDGAMHGAIQHGELYETEQTEEIKAWLRRHNVVLNFADAWKLFHDMNWNSRPSQTPRQEDEPDESKRNDKLVGQIVMHAKRKGRTDLPYEIVNAWANRQVSIPKKDKLTSIEVLIRRREHLQRLLLSVLQGSDDAAASA